MRPRKSKSSRAKAKTTAPAEPSNGGHSITESGVPPPDAFLEQAKQEPKRKLLADHTGTISVLRNEKRFTFRQIAEWLTARGIETDHSGVYRAYLASIPPERRDPSEDWDDVVPD